MLTDYAEQLKFNQRRIKYSLVLGIYELESLLYNYIMCVCVGGGMCVADPEYCVFWSNMQCM